MAYGDNYAPDDYGRAMAEFEMDVQRQRDKAEAQKLADTAEGRKNWQQDAIKGAQLGSIAGPWGTLAGLVGGAAKGSAEAFGQYRKEGHGVLGSIGKTLFDFKRGVNDDTFKTAMGAAPAIAGALRGKMREGVGTPSVEQDAMSRAIDGNYQLPDPQLGTTPDAAAGARLSGTGSLQLDQGMFGDLNAPSAPAFEEAMGYKLRKPRY